MRRWLSPVSYSSDHVGLLFGVNGVSVLTSHLIVGYHSVGLSVSYLCGDVCSLISRLRFVGNVSRQLNGTSFISFLSTFSACSCFYSIFPGDRSEIDYFSWQLLIFFIVLLLVGEGGEFRRLMQIFGLHPLVHWTGRLLFDLFFTLFYSFLLYFISSQNEESSSSLNVHSLQHQTNIEVKKRFYLFSGILSLTTLPFVYLLSSKYLFFFFFFVSIVFFRLKNCSNRICCLVC